MYDKCFFCLDQLPKLKKESTASFFVNFGGAGVQKSRPTLLQEMVGIQKYTSFDKTRRASFPGCDYDEHGESERRPDLFRLHLDPLTLVGSCAVGLLSHVGKNLIPGAGFRWVSTTQLSFVEAPFLTVISLLHKSTFHSNAQSLISVSFSL